MKPAALLLALVLPQAAMAAGDPAIGAKLFLQCRACHMIGATDANGVGPNLNNVVGAKAASRASYTYSPALAQSGLTWTPANLDAFLTKPSGLVPGTRMAFTGVPTPEARANLIAYLATLKR